MILNADNEETRKIFERCIKQGKAIINPIVDWTDSDVWEFLNHYGCKSNPLYQCGYNRVGCVGCPMDTKKEKAFDRYPKYAENYIRAFDRMLKENAHLPYTWKTGQDVFDWWISGKAMPRELENQIGMEEVIQ